MVREIPSHTVPVRLLTGLEYIHTSDNTIPMLRPANCLRSRVAPKLMLFLHCVPTARPAIPFVSDHRGGVDLSRLPIKSSQARKFDQVVHSGRRSHSINSPDSSSEGPAVR